MTKDNQKEVESYLDSLVKGLPHVCDYCNFFSGNMISGAGIRPAKCRNPQSPKYKNVVQEETSCIKFIA